MTYKELILDFINSNYAVSRSLDMWCVYNKFNGKRLIVPAFINDIKRIFPDTDIDRICKDWFETHINKLESIIYEFLDDYEIVPSNGIYAWVLKKFGVGPEFKIDDLLRRLPHHCCKYGVEKIYLEWFENAQIKKCEEFM